MEQHSNRFDGELLTQAIIGAAIEVHTTLGPGLLETAYQDAICYELEQLELKFVRQPSVSFGYKTIQIDRVFRPDLKLTGLKTGLIFNFNTRLLKSGMRRIEPYPLSLIHI